VSVAAETGCGKHFTPAAILCQFRAPEELSSDVGQYSETGLIQW